ncbi:ArsR/SmtB family transcription factor [Legionella sp. 227]|uniref:ArsR/SmtB family transcription factor n=1 Tax=Legionella sp. 227 TaxID=3367288 RepID=UPI00370D5716
MVTYTIDMDNDLIFKALADKSRRTLLDALCARNGQNLNELCEHLSMSRQAVMKHLHILEDANLVVVHWEGREKLHYLNPVPLQETFGRWIAKYERNRLLALDNLKSILEHDKSSSSPKKRK